MECYQEVFSMVCDFVGKEFALDNERRHNEGHRQIRLSGVQLTLIERTARVSIQMLTIVTYRQLRAFLLAQPDEAVEDVAQCSREDVQEVVHVARIQYGYLWYLLWVWPEAKESLDDVITPPPVHALISSENQAA